MVDFGVGTFFTLANAAYSAYKAFNAAGPSFRDLAADTEALQDHLVSTGKQVEKYRYKLDSDLQDRVNSCARRCKRGVRKAQALLHKYPSLKSKKRRFWEQLNAAMFQDVESLRTSLRDCVGWLTRTETSIIAFFVSEQQDRGHSIRRRLSEMRAVPQYDPNLSQNGRVHIIPMENRAQQPSRGRTPLHKACAAGDTNLVAYLLRQGATPTVRTQGSRGNALHIATWYGHLPVMRLLLDDDSVSAENHVRGPRSKTQLVNDRARRAETMGKTQMRNRASKSKDLLEMRDVDGDTPLHIAVEKRDLAAVLFLLTKGATSTIDMRNNKGLAPLHGAAKHGLADIAQLLLDNGARTSIKDNERLTAFDLAKKGKHERCMWVLEKHIDKCIQKKAVKAVEVKYRVRPKRGWFG